jgi:hypothetical protein
MKNAQVDIRALVDSFVDQLTRRIRTAAVESVQMALLDGKASASSKGRRGRKPGPKPGPKPKAAKAGKRGRRTPAEIEAAKASIAAYVKANPGCPMSDITDALGLDSITLRAQVNELLDAGSIRKEGKKRGTRYFAGSGNSKPKTTRGKKAAKRKTAKKRATKKKTTRKKAA